MEHVSYTWRFLDEKIIELLQDVNKDADFTKSDDFISDGLLDSMDLQMLAVAIEDEYGVKFAPVS